LKTATLILPTWDEADKIDRFLAGLSDLWQGKAIVNPLTGRRWEEFQPMVNYLVSLLGSTAAASSSAVAKGLVVPQNNGNVERPTGQQVERRPARPAWQRQGRQQRFVRRAQGRQLNAAGRRQQNVVSRAANNRKIFQNADGVQFWRTKAQMTYIIAVKRDMCACCFSPGHRYQDCHATPVRTAPPGYVEWRAQQNS